MRCVTLLKSLTPLSLAVAALAVPTTHSQVAMATAEDVVTPSATLPPPPPLPPGGDCDVKRGYVGAGAFLPGYSNPPTYRESSASRDRALVIATD